MAESERRPLRALLLTAGLGTRLRPLSDIRAKAAVPINGQSLVQRAMTWLGAAGIRDLVLNLHHRPASITSQVGDGLEMGARVRYSWEQPVLGSAGGPRHALPLLCDDGSDHFLIVNGDTLTDLDVRELIEHHRRCGALVTMALIVNPSPEKYGGVLVSPDGWVTGFGARASGLGARDSGLGARASGLGSYHFIGVQVAQAETFARLEDGVPAESVNKLYPALIAENPHAVAAYVSSASFLDIGTPRDCLETSLALADVEGPRLIGDRAQIDSSAALSRCVVWDDVKVGARAQLHACIVADGVRIPDDARFERCAIVPAGTRAPRDDERVDGSLLIRSL